MVLIAFHGKEGSGKDESTKCTKEILSSERTFKHRAFAAPIKELISVLSRTSIETQYSVDGKNSWVEIIDADGVITCAVQDMVSLMNDFGVFLKRTNHSEIVKDILIEACKETEKNGRKVVDERCYLTVGVLQQEIGTKFRKEYHDDIWVDVVFRDWDPEQDLIISDLRFPNEKKAIQIRKGLCIKLVGDPMGVRSRSLRDPNHISEIALDNDDNWDIVIDNNMNNRFHLYSQLLHFYILNGIILKK